MSKYYPAENLSFDSAPVRGGIDIEKSVVWEGDFGMSSAFFRMPKGMCIPQHTHPMWVQVMVVDGEIEVESESDGKVSISSGGCYFVEPGDTHTETAVVDSIVLVTQGEDRPEFQ